MAYCEAPTPNNPYRAVCHNWVDKGQKCYLHGGKGRAAKVVLFDTDCTVVSADLNALRPGIREMFALLIKLGYEIAMWSGVAGHAAAQAAKWHLPVTYTLDKLPYRRGAPMECPEEFAGRLVLVVDDDPSESVKHVPLMVVEHYIRADT